LPEALARIRREPTLSAPAREAGRPLPRPAKSAPANRSPGLKGRIWIPKTVGGYASIFMVLALGGIVVNAVGLQHERHPAPLFAPGAASQPASVPAAVLPPQAPAAAVSAPKTEAAASPTARPSLPAPAGRKTDPIGDWLRGGPAPETTKTVIAAQRALIKLGYDLQADGLMGATTEEALHDFEKSHGLPTTSELSPHLMAKLNGAGR
jgi:hypothetical protein